MTSAVSDIQPELARDVKLMYSGRWGKKKTTLGKAFTFSFQVSKWAQGAPGILGGLGWVRVVDPSIYVLGTWIPGYLDTSVPGYLNTWIHLGPPKSHLVHAGGQPGSRVAKPAVHRCPGVSQQKA